MIVRFKGLLWVPGLLALLGGCSRDEPRRHRSRLPAAQQAVAPPWRRMSIGASMDSMAETRFSPLADISDDNVGAGPGRYFDYPTGRACRPLHW